MNVKALIVEDEQVIRSLLSRMIVKKYPFCTVVEAKNGIEGIAAVETENPDVVFLDARMPMMNGLEVLSVIRGNPRHKRLPVYIITSVRERDAVMKFIQLGVSGYILKPIENAVIYTGMDKIIANLHSAEKSPNLSRKSILLIEPDAVYSSFFTTAISSFATVRVASGASDALRMFAGEIPTDVCISEFDSSKAGETDERLLARKLKNIAPSSDVKVFIINKSGILQQEEARFFNGAIKRSFQQSEFLNSVMRSVFEQKDACGILKVILGNPVAQHLKTIISDFLSSVNLRATIADYNQKPTKHEIKIVASIVAPKEETETLISLEGEKKHLEMIARRMGKSKDDIASAFSVFLAAIQRGIIAVLEKFNIEAEEKDIKIKRDEGRGVASSSENFTASEVSVILDFEGEEKLYLSVSANKIPAITVMV